VQFYEEVPRGKVVPLVKALAGMEREA
jgi:hypothetical protein